MQVGIYKGDPIVIDTIYPIEIDHETSTVRVTAIMLSTLKREQILLFCKVRDGEVCILDSNFETAEDFEHRHTYIKLLSNYTSIADEGHAINQIIHKANHIYEALTKFKELDNYLRRNLPKTTISERTEAETNEVDKDLLWGLGCIADLELFLAPLVEL